MAAYRPTHKGVKQSWLTGTAFDVAPAAWQAQNTPPPGTYDPTLDASEQAAIRGFGYLGADTATKQDRLRTDYGLGQEDITRTRDRGVADLRTAEGREVQNYDRNVGELQRSFQRLGSRQSQQAASMGILSGGSLLQSAAKRAANEAFARAPLDTAHTRAAEDFRLQFQRGNENADTALGKLALEAAPPDAANPLGGRQWQDLSTDYTRAGNELGSFVTDTAAQKAYQAGALGWLPPMGDSTQTFPRTPRVPRRFGSGFRIPKRGPFRG